MRPSGSAGARTDATEDLPIGSDVSRPDLSIILLQSGPYEWLRRTIREWRAQGDPGRIEVVIVRPVGSNDAVEDADLAPFHSWRVVDVPALDSCAAGFAAGVHAASAPVVMLAEDHAFPEPGLAEALLAAYEADPGLVAVGPCLANANPRTLASVASFVVAFGAAAFAREDRPANELAGHNTSYRRALLLEYGDDLADRYESDRNFQYDLVAKGGRMRLLARPRIRHFNASVWSAVIGHAFQGGRVFAARRSRDWGVVRRTAYIVGAPLIPVIRLRRILADVRESPADFRAIVPLRIPALLMPLAAHAAGELAGYLLGAGDSEARYAPYELRRRNVLDARDRAGIDGPGEAGAGGSVTAH